MDIRNFFGGNSSSRKKTKISEDNASADVLEDLQTNKSALNNDNNEKQSNNDASINMGDSEKFREGETTTITNSPGKSTKSAASFNNKENSTANHEGKITDIAVLPRELRDIVVWSTEPPKVSIATNGDSGIVPYLALVDTFELISKHSGRLDKESLFTKFFRAVMLTAPQDLCSVVYLSSNTMAPAYQGLELGIGDSLLVKAICEATGRKREAVEEDYKREGDLGVVALLSRASQKTLSFAAKPKPLMATFVLDQLRKITETKGENAQSRKVNIIKSLMVRCQGNEAKYIGKLRIGTAEQTVLVALGHAFAQSPTRGLEVSNDEDEQSDEDIEEENTESDVAEKINTTSSDKKAVTDADIVSLEELLSKIEERVPFEAKKLCDKSKRLTKEKAKELAVIAVKRAFSESPSLDVLINSLLNNAIYDIHKLCRLCPGIPVAPMLAKPTKQSGEVLKRLFGLAFTMEYKYDGERAQVHFLSNGEVKIFSRKSEDNSNKYPDLSDVVLKAKESTVVTCVVDAEVVAFDREKGLILPFQVLSTRKRKVEDGDEDQKVKVALQAFDLLYINGKSLLSQPLRARRELLRSAFHQVEVKYIIIEVERSVYLSLFLGHFYFASGMDHVENGDTAPIETFLQEACSAMCEGLMIKTLDNNASYEPSKRSLNWLKLKKVYIDGMGICDSVDLVVIGGYHGRGKRGNVYGAYLMACYDPETDEFQSVCKVIPVYFIS